SGTRILIVDGDASRAERLARALEAAGAGIPVRRAGSLREFREAAASAPPDIALAALALPDGRLVEALTDPPEDGPFPVLVLAGPGEEDAAADAQRAGALDFVAESPQAPPDMPRVVARALREWKLLRERKALRAELELGEARLRSIFSASPMGIGMVVHRILQEVNDTILRMTGYSREELIGRSARILYPSEEEFRAVGSEKYRQISVSGTGTVECRWMRKDGGIIDILLASSVLDPDDLAKGVTFTALDITARKRAEDALRESETNFRELTRQFHFILDAFPDNIVRQTGDLRVTWANRSAVNAIRAARAADTAGGEPWDPVGKCCYFLWHGRSSPCEPCPVLQTFRTGEPAHGIATSSDGRVWELRTVPVIEGGGVKEVVEIGRDLTESRKMEEQLRQARNMETVGRLAGGIAHDFNNMLNVILGYSEIVLNRLPPGSPNVPDIEEIIKAGRRSANMIGQLLAFSRKQIVAPKVVRMNEAIAEQMNMLQRMIGEDVRIGFHPGEGLWNIRIDPSQVTQILANLAVNARDAIDGVGSITIGTANVEVDEAYRRTRSYALPGEYVMLSFSDTGTGMDAETLEQIFEPFFTTKAPGKGTGLGLSTVYGIVKQNGGFINAYSEPRIGSTFRIYFPRIREDAAAAVHTARETPPLGTETILLVEDEEQILSLAARILENQGYRVLAAGTPEAALQLAERHDGEIRLLLTDVVMPGMNGRDLQRRIEALRPGIRTLFMSGYTEDAVVHRGILDKGVFFVPKPFTVRLLAEKVRSVLDA
ncbi:MAG: sensor hybrid histidine kinase, partial [Deltaproteobacteria bacterium]|nr:sensor hybrid histidine kinase [Deltaproteobacteria bacterium]